MKKILWIGSVLPKEKINYFIKKGLFNQFAANTTQWYYIKGIDSINNYNVDILSALKTIGYPRGKKLFIKHEYFNHSENADDVNVSFLNIDYLSNISRTYYLKKELKKWMKNNKEEEISVVIYSLHYPFLAIAKILKKYYTDIKILMIVPDLPQYMSKYKGIKKLLKKIDIVNIKKNLKIIDGYVFYTKHMIEYFPDKSKYIVLEGITNISNNDVKTKIKHKNSFKEKIICLYAGGISYRYKVNLLVNAFLLGNVNNAELHLYGDGDYVDDLKYICNNNNNIKYYGVISPNLLRKKMQNSSLLLNFRNSNDEYTKYSCPSKILEYMSSGVPVLMNKLKGIPNEYYKYVYLFDNNKIENMAKILKNILNLPIETLRQKGELAQQFVFNNKNYIVQSNKLINFLESL